MSGYNIVASAEVTAGTVTINLKDVPVMTALDTILEMQGLWYTKEVNIIRVMTMAEFKASRAARAELTKVYRLQYAVASDLATVLNSVLGGAVKKEAPTKISRLESPEAIEKYMAIAGLKFKGKTFVIADKRTNSLIVTTDAPENLIMLEMLIRQLDTEVPQVLIEVAIVDVTLTDEDKLGINWTWKDLHTGTIREAPELTGTMEWAPDITGPYTLFLSNKHIDVLVRALAERNKLDILSTPRILTLDNEEAVIYIGTEEPVLQDISYDEDTGKWDYDYEYEEMGTKLTVTPQINPDKFVRLKLKQEIRRYKGTRTVEMAEGTAELPTYDIQEATASMLVKNGHTVIVGGMIKEETVEFKSKVPFLGSIPGVGLLFRKKELKKERKELIMLATPYVITSPGEAREVTEREKGLLTTPPRELGPAKKKPGVIEDTERMIDMEELKRYRRKKRKEKPGEVEEKEIEIPEIEEEKKK
jgi:type II secretion system protein D